jgi:hypothetical protein
MGGIMASSPELMNTVQKFNVGGQVQLSPFAKDLMQGYAGMAADVYGSAPIRAIRDFIGYDYGQTGIGQIQAENERIAAERRAERAQQIADVDRVNTITSQMRNIQDFEGRERAGSVPTLRGPTAADVQSPEFQGSARMSDLLSESVVPTKMEGFDKVGEYSVSEGAPSFGPDDLRVTPTETETETDATDTKKPEPPTLDPDEIDRYGAEELAEKGDQLRQEAISLIENPNVSETEKNNSILELAGYKDPQEGMSFKERAEANAKMYKDIFGEDPEGDKKIDGYNLAMLGFLIASGDSPRALENIAKGAAQGTKLFMDTAKQRRARDQKFKMLGLDKAIRDDETRKKIAIETARTLEGRKFDLLMNQIKSTENRELLALRMNAEESQLMARLNTQQQIAADNTASAERRAQANQEAELLAAQIKSLDAVGALAFSRSGTDTEQFNEEVDKILNNPEDLAQAVQISQMGRSSKAYELMPSREEYVLKYTAQALKDFAILDTIARDLGVDPNNLKSEDIRRFYGSMYDQETALRSQSQQTPAPQYPTVTTQEEYDALPPGAVFIQNGQQRQKPAQ